LFFTGESTLLFVNRNCAQENSFRPDRNYARGTLKISERKKEKNADCAKIRGGFYGV
jgi:hypothetical protein